MAVHTWTVDELCSAIGEALRVVFPDELWIRGQISGLRRSAAGHVYFDLVDPDSEGRGADTKISVVAFRGQLRGIQAVLAGVGVLRVEDGLAVRIRGRVDYYPPQGRVQFLMNAIDPRYTLGQLAAERDEVLRRLAAEGLLDVNHRLELPLVPLTVGLVTSHDSAAYNDFVEELRRSGFPFRILFADARVQGLEAEASLIDAVEAVAARRPDVVAVVRGGGARTDLIAFDREAVARSVAACPVPVFVGIGHEIDRSVVDEVAHSSLKTPTACAAALVERVGEFDRRLDLLAGTIATRSSHLLARAHERVDRDTRQLARSTGTSVRLHGRLLDAASSRLTAATRRGLSSAERTLADAGRRLGNTRQGLGHATTQIDERADRLVLSARRLLREHEGRLVAASGLTAALHPDRILARGFSVTRTAAGALVTDTPAPDTHLVTETATAVIESRVVAASSKEDT